MTAACITFIVILLLFSAFFSASETAYSSLNKNRLKTAAEKGQNRPAEIACKLSDHYDKLIATILIGNNLVNILLASFSTVLFVKWFGEKGALISSIGITAIVIIFGEITPKTLAKDCPERLAMAVAPFLNILIWILTPVCNIFSAWTHFLIKSFHLQPSNKVSSEELLLLVDEVQQGGSINSNEGELLRNAIEFSEQEAKDIATPRVKLAAVPITMDKADIAAHFTETKFSRLIVYENNIDNIVGAIHRKNFFTGRGITPRPVRDIITPPLFVSTNEKISLLLRKLQRRKAQLAVVIDEFGGTYGIVTMEDVLEELVGEIWDETDDIIEPFKRISDTLVQVDASVDFDDFSDYFHLDIESDMVSVNGWVIDNMDGIPQVGESFNFKNLTITIQKVEHRCVSQIEVTIHPDTAHAPEATEETEE